jgi:hypothetical protein
VPWCSKVAGGFTAHSRYDSSSSLSFSQSAVAAGRDYAGLTQRVLFLELLAWFVAMGWLGYRERLQQMNRTGADD